MATAKNETGKKRGRPSNKQDVTVKKSDNKTTKKTDVKKNILTSKKEPKKTDLKKTKKTDISLVNDTKNEQQSEVNVIQNEAIVNPVIEEKKEEKVYNPNNQNGIGILPVEDDSDNDNKNTINVNNNIQKVYTCKKDASFMNGYLKVGIDNTNISRRNDTFFDIYGKSEHGAEFKTEFECIDKEEGDFLQDELNDYEKSPDKYIIEEKNNKPEQQQQQPKQEETKSHALDAHGNIDMTKLTAVEIAAIHNKNMPDEKKVQNLTGVPLTSVNIDEMINNLPPKTENQNINPINTNSIAPTSKAVDISNILNNQNTAQIRAYAQSISDHINTSFQANVWGGMPQNDVRLFLTNCDKQYLYELINDGTGFYLIVKKDSIQVRMPENPTEYLKVK